MPYANAFQRLAGFQRQQSASTIMVCSGHGILCSTAHLGFNTCTMNVIGTRTVMVVRVGRVTDCICMEMSD